MKNCLSVFLFFTIISVQLVSTKVYTRCGLTQELLRQGFPRTFIGNWVCLIESESAKDTSKVTNKANGSKGLGLFQIRSKEWCTYQTPGGKCNMKCEGVFQKDFVLDFHAVLQLVEDVTGGSGNYLTDEDISDDSSCAKKVQGQLGFRGWDGWLRSCYRRKLPIPNC